MATKRRSKSAASEAARYLASLGASKGGLASAAALTPEERKARAKMAIAARWASRPKGELPVDQLQVMRRLEGVDSVVLRKAPGAGGARRRSAIASLERSGHLRVTAETATEITLRPVGMAPALHMRNQCDITDSMAEPMHSDLRVQHSRLARSAAASELVAMANAKGHTLRTLADTMRAEGLQTSQAAISLAAAGKRPIALAVARRIEALVGYPAIPASWPKLRSAASVDL